MKKDRKDVFQNKKTKGMKKCINKQCGAVMDDEIKKCPICGKMQGHVMMSEQVDESEDVVVAVRPGFVTFYLSMMIVFNGLEAFVDFFPKAMWGSDFPDKYVVPSVFLGVFAIVDVIGAWMLLSYKKKGFYVILVSSIIANLIGLLCMGSNPYGLVGVLVLWLILQIKNNGIPYWEMLGYIEKAECGEKDENL